MQKTPRSFDRRVFAKADFFTYLSGHHLPWAPPAHHFHASPPPLGHLPCPAGPFGPSGHSPLSGRPFIPPLTHLLYHTSLSLSILAIPYLPNSVMGHEPGDGEMGRWRDGEMGRWGDGEMGRWRDGTMGLSANPRRRQPANLPTREAMGPWGRRAGGPEGRRGGGPIPVRCIRRYDFAAFKALRGLFHI